MQATVPLAALFFHDDMYKPDLLAATRKRTKSLAAFTRCSPDRIDYALHVFTALLNVTLESRTTQRGNGRDLLIVGQKGVWSIIYDLMQELSAPAATRTLRESCIPKQFDFGDHTVICRAGDGSLSIGCGRALGQKLTLTDSAHGRTGMRRAFYLGRYRDGNGSSP